MENNVSGRVRKVAFSGLFSALVFVVLYLGSLTTSEWTFIFAASFLIGLSVALSGIRYGFLITAVINILGYLLIFRTSYVFTFTFVSFYSPYRFIFDKKKWLIQWFGKFSYFNSSLFAWIFLYKYFFGIDVFEMAFKIVRNVLRLNLSNFIVIGMIILCLEFFFVVYDYLLGRFISIGLIRIRNVIGYREG
ncbi:MAG: hypothetical protein N2Z58_05715 [Fervidobacterium sp.]|nr:hypothetical protein [Fervidobacterium sp.]